MSRKASERMINKMDTTSNIKRSNAGKREDLSNQFFRSSWEANFARYLNYKNIPWEFEPKTFFFKNVKRGALSYTPDFFVKDTIIEVKGFFTSKDRGKINRFKKQYPLEFAKLWFVIKNKGNNKQTKYIEKIGKIDYIIEYNELEKTYKNSIEHWELPKTYKERSQTKIEKAIELLLKKGYEVSNERK